MNVYEVIQDQTMPDSWIVEMVDAEGEIEVTRFTGPHCEERARGYAASRGIYYE